jgi:hypothetical protein
MNNVKMDEPDWRALCELASKETDPQRLYELVEQLNDALEARAKRLQGQMRDGNSSPHARIPPDQKKGEEGQA